MVNNKNKGRKYVSIQANKKIDNDFFVIWK